MEIKINGQTADITIENENTAGEVMAALEHWLSGLGHRITGISVNSQKIDAAMLNDEFFAKQISEIKVLDVYTSPFSGLAAESLAILLSDIEEYEKLGFEEKKEFFDSWNNKTHVNFAREHMSDLYNLYLNTLSGGEINPRVVFSITEERLRETKDPVTEFSNMQVLITEICSLLCDLPLDIQTGKDAKAAQTIQLFSGIAEKILRLLKQLDIQGLLNTDKETGKQLTSLINDFNDLSKQLLDAYEKYDTVLVGDLAEYEASPSIQELYNSIKKSINKPAEVVNK